MGAGILRAGTQLWGEESALMATTTCHGCKFGHKGKTLLERRTQELLPLTGSCSTSHPLAQHTQQNMFGNVSAPSERPACPTSRSTRALARGDEEDTETTSAGPARKGRVEGEEER